LAPTSSAAAAEKTSHLRSATQSSMPRRGRPGHHRRDASPASSRNRRDAPPSRRQSEALLPGWGVL